MAVQAQHLLTPAFLPHDIGHAFRALEGDGSVFLDEFSFGGCAPAPAPIGDAAFGDAQLRSELTCNGSGGGESNVFLPRKRARVAPGFMDDGPEQQGLILPLPLPVPHGQVFAGDVQSTAGGYGAASTSGRAVVANGVLSLLYHQGVEIDALVRLETERMRAGLQEARRRHARAVFATVVRTAASRLRAAEAELERARCRNAELEERLRQLTAEGQACLGVAKSHEAVAATLRTTLEQLLQQPAAAGGAGDCDGEAEDAQSWCFETSPSGGLVADDDAASSRGSSLSCKSCGGPDACVLLLPCRHLCLCRACETAAEVCPVCAAAKNASLQVLLQVHEGRRREVLIHHLRREAPPAQPLDPPHLASASAAQPVDPCGGPPAVPIYLATRSRKM